MSAKFALIWYHTVYRCLICNIEAVIFVDLLFNWCLSECRCGTLLEKNWNRMIQRQSKSVPNTMKQLTYIYFGWLCYIHLFFSQCPESCERTLHGSLFTHQTISASKEIHYPLCEYEMHVCANIIMLKQLFMWNKIIYFLLNYY